MTPQACVTSKGWSGLLFMLLMIVSISLKAQQEVRIIWPLTTDSEAVYTTGIGSASFASGPGLQAFSYDTLNGATASGWNSRNLNPRAYYEYILTPERDATLLINQLKFEVSLSSVNMRTALYYSKDGFRQQSVPLGNPVFVGKKSSRDLTLATAITVTYPEILSIRVYGWSAPTPAVSFFARDVEFSGVIKGPMAPPIAYDVTGGGGYCAGGPGATINLSNSEVGVNYALLLGGTPTGTTLPGTGSPLSFTNVTTAGTYTISGTNPEGTTPMNGSAMVAVLQVPVATANPSTSTICSGQNVSIALTSTVSGTTFNWTVVASGVSGASNGSTSGVGASISQTLSTTGPIQGTATYTVTPATATCTGTPITVVVTVNPRPVLTITPTSQNICSGSTTALALTSNVAGTTFSWTQVPSGVSGSSNGSGNSITQTLATTGASNGTVTYTVTPTSAMCSGTNVSAIVTVRPTPVITASPASQTACPDEDITNIDLTSTIGGTTYSWARTPVPELTELESGTGSPIAGTIFSSTPWAMLTTTFTIIGTAPNGCTATATSVVNIGDLTAPVINCPVAGPVNVTTTTGCTYVHTGTSWNATFTETCKITNFSYTLTGATSGTGGNLNGVAFNIGTTTVTWSVTDIGNHTVTCSFDVTVTDDDKPVFSYCPGNQTSGTNTNCTYVHSGTGWDATATDNCSGPITLSWVLTGATTGVNGNTTLNGVTFNKGTTTVTWTATDPAGNYSTCTYTVTVNDDDPPSITCPGNQTRGSNNTGCTYLASGTEFDPVAYSDNCPGSVISNTLNGSTTLAGYSFNQGVTSVTWTITAANGQTAQCIFTVTIIDDQLPVFSNCPADISVNTGMGNTTCSQVATWTPPTVIDNCGSVTVTSNYNPGATFSVGTTTVTYTAVDGAGNTATCTFQVTVIDNTYPIFTAPSNITVWLTSSCTYNAGIGITGDVTSEYDNCTHTGLQATFTDVTVNGTCPGTFIITRTWSLTDIHNNTTTHDQIITVADNLKPAITKPADITIQCNSGTNTGTATGTDNCGGLVTISYTDVLIPNPNCPAGSTINRTWSATDCCGNVATATQIITVIDNTPPVVTNIANVTVACPANIPEPNINVITASDNCGTISIVLYDEIPMGLDGQPGYCPTEVHRIYRVSDQCGNFTDATQIITVVSTCGCSPCATSYSFWLVDLSLEPTGVIVIPGVIREDKCCDAKKEECASFNVKIPDGAVGVQIDIDGATPSPQDWRIDCNTVIINGNIICIPGGEFHLFTYCKPGQNTNTFTFHTIEGIIQSGDIVARVECNSQLSINSTVDSVNWTSVWPGVPGQYNSYLSCLDCPNPVFTPGVGSPPEIQYEVCGTIPDSPCIGPGGEMCDTITVHVYDAIKVTFDVDPGAFCNDNIPLITATVTPPATTYTLFWYNGPDGTGAIVGNGYTFQPLETGLHSLVVIDTQNGIPCSTLIYNFFVAPDDQPPIVTAPADLILECNDANNEQLIQDWLVTATAIDDHDLNPTISNDYTGIIQGCNSSVVVTFSASDICGNTGQATATIFINDTQLPVWLSNAGDLDRTFECSDATALTNAQALTPSASDQCDPTLTVTKTPGNFVANPACPQGGTYTNTFIATDDCNNSSTVYTQVITITDLTAPVWTTAAGALNTTLQCSDASGLAAAQALSPAATDNCDAAVTITKTSGALVPGTCPTLGTYTNTFVAKDACGNASLQYTQIITIIDLASPVITTPAANMTVECDGSGNLTDLNNWLNNQGGAIASDACGGNITWTNDFTTLSNLCGGTGAATVVFTAKDVCNNGITTTATFTITDLTPPDLTCPADVTSQVDPTNCEATGVVLGTPVTTDLCSGPVSVSNNAPVAFPAGVTIVTWTATDDCGNIATCTQNVTIIDNTPPTVDCPVSPIEVNADPGVCQASVTVPSPVVTDPCPYTMTNSYTGTNNASGTYPVGTTTVTWTITGISLNTTECTQIVTVIDNQTPTIICPPDVLVTAPAPACSLQVKNILPPTLNDNCDVANLILTWVKNGATSGSGTGDVNYTIFNVGVTTVTYTVTDASGNSATCNFTVTVHDEVPPTIITCPGNMTVNNDPGFCYADLVVDQPVVNDECGEIVSVSNSFNGTSNASGQYPIGTTVVTWTITDVSNNSTTCTQNITVNDTELPVISCPGNVTATAVPPDCTVPSITVNNPVYSDNCPGSVLTWTKAGATTGNGTGLVNNTPFSVGVTTVTYTVTDASGNSANCNFTVTVHDEVPPTFVDCPDDIIVSNDPGDCFAMITVPEPLVNDLCGEIVSVSNSFNGTPNASGQYPIGTTVVIWTITDVSNNSTTCTQNITVNDTELPVISCPGNVTATAVPPDCIVPSITVDNPVYSDNCSGSVLTWTKTGATTGNGTGLVNNTPFSVGVTVVTYTITDASGNVATCDFTVTIHDEVPPTFVDCPDDITVSNDPGDCFAMITVPEPVVNDECGEIVSVSNSFNGTSNASGQYPIGTTVVIWTITDVSNNSTTCTQNITVNDTELPVISCPDDVTATAVPPDCIVPSITVDNPVYSDNCSGSVLTWTKTGATTGNGTGLVNNTPFSVGVTVVTYTITDASGNIATCYFTVTVHDEVPPTFVDCPDDITVSNDPGDCFATITVPEPVVNDLCGEIVSVSNSFNGTPNASGQYPIGTTVVTWTITDVSNNSTTCTQNITVNDTELPVISCPGNVTATAVPPDCIVPSITVDNPVYSDNCSGSVLTWTKTGATTGNGTGLVNNTPFSVGVTVVTYTITDASGNVATCDFTVTVHDEVPPTFVDCPDDITVSNDPGDCFAMITVPEPVVNDECGEIVSVSNSFNGTPNASGQYPIGTTVVTWTITDVSNNSTTCTQNITVNDTELPVISCPGNVTATAVPPDCIVPAITLGLPVYSDNCTGSSIAWVLTGATTGSGNGTITAYDFHVGTTLMTYTVTDASGNKTSCSFSIIIHDQVPPTVIDCPDDITQSADPDACNTYILVGLPDVVDPCDEIVTITHDSPIGTTTDPSGYYNVGEYTITWTFTDESGNISTCTQIITVEDNQDPVFTFCPPDVLAEATPPECDVPNITLGIPTYTDNCPNPILTYSMSGPGGISSGSGVITQTTFPVGTTEIIYTVTDASENTTICSFLVVVHDDVPPTIIYCPDDETANTDPDECTAYVTVDPPVVEDPCDEIVFVTNNSPYGIDDTNASGTYPVGITTITWTFTDESGNTRQCTNTVTVIDNQIPVFTFCPTDIVLIAEPPLCEVPDVILDEPTFTDNCTPVLSWTLEHDDPYTIDSGTGFVDVTTFQSGVTTITYTVTDPSGNTDICVFTVTVFDQVPPTIIVCPPDVTVYAPADACVVDLVIPAPLVDDPCNEIVTISHNSPYSSDPTNASGTYPVGNYLIIWTFVDESGNSDTCQQRIRVIDNTDPLLICPPSFTVDAAFEQPYAVNVVIPAPTYSDACGWGSLIWVLSGATTGASPLIGLNELLLYPQLNVGVNTITYTATDINGNISTCSFTITVLSEPEIDCPDDINTTTDPGVCSATLDPGGPTKISGAEPITWTYTIRDEGGTVLATSNTCTSATLATCIGNFTFPVGTNTITWTATNVSGTVDCIQTIIITDDEAPTFTLPTSRSYCVNNVVTATYNPSPTLGIIPEYDDVTVPRPEYYIFTDGSTLFDLDPIINNLFDNCTAIDNLLIHWRLDFSATPNPATALHELNTQPPIPEQMGQPSEYGEIHFPGDGVYFTNVEHYMYFWLEDLSNNISEVKMITIIITPRPNVIKQP